MPPAARVNDPTSHSPPLNPGIGSLTVMIGNMPAWRALPSSVASAVESVSNAVKNFMQKPALNPASATADLAQISSGLGQAAGQASAAGNPAATGATAGAATALNTTNVALTTAWTTASAVPGGQPAADQAYTQGIKAAMAAAASSVFASIGGMTDIHICPIPCPIPPHGPGVVTKGSKTVMIDNLPATRQGDKVFEACGGEDPIAMGCPTVLIGDEGGSGGGGGGGGGAAGGGGAGQSSTTEAQQAVAEPADYTDTEPQPAAPGESEQSVGTSTHWIEIELVDEAEQPVVGELYEIVLPDGDVVRGGTDARGQARVTGIEQAGACTISFRNLDLAAWERWAPGTGARPAAAGATQPQTASIQRGPVRGGSGRTELGQWRPIGQGECISSIAKDTGHFWDTIWNHGLNAQLKQRRGDPNVLLPGDAVFVPAKRPKTDAGNTDQHHKFLRKGEPARLRLVLMQDGEPRAGVPYTLEIDGRQTTGVTNADGQVDEAIPGNARRGKLTIGAADEGQEEVPLRLGALDPVAEVSGVRDRLANLGVDVGYGAALDPKTRAALRRFQESEDLEVTGEPDEPTRRRLVELHGS